MLTPADHMDRWRIDYQVLVEDMAVREYEAVVQGLVVILEALWCELYREDDSGTEMHRPHPLGHIQLHI